MSHSRDAATPQVVLNVKGVLQTYNTAVTLPAGVPLKFSGTNLVAAADTDTKTVVGFSTTESVNGKIAIVHKGGMEMRIRANVASAVLGANVTWAGTVTNEIPDYVISTTGKTVHGKISQVDNGVEVVLLNHLEVV